MGNTQYILRNYETKLADGTLAFVAALKMERPEYIAEKEGYCYLKEPAFVTCEVQDYRELLDEPVWSQFRKDRVEPYFGFKPVHVPLPGTPVLTRQYVIEHASPPHLIIEAYKEHEAQFPSQPNRYCSDMDIRDYAQGWAIAVVRNLGAVVTDRAAAIAKARTRMARLFCLGVLVSLGLGHTMDFAAWGLGILRGAVPLSAETLALAKAVAIAAGLVASVFFILGFRAVAVDTDNQFKKAAVKFMNLTRQSSLTLGKLISQRRERLDRVHNFLWEAANRLKEKCWAADKPKQWAELAQRYIRTALWVNACGRSLDEVMRVLHSFILMGYAAHTVDAEFRAHYLVFSKNAVAKSLWIRVVEWVWGGGPFMPMIWNHRAKWALGLGIVVLAGVCNLWILGRTGDTLDAAMALTAATQTLAPGLLFLAVWFYLGRVEKTFAMPDEPTVADDIRGAMPDITRSPVKELESAILEHIEHEINRLLIEEEKH